MEFRNLDPLLNCLGIGIYNQLGVAINVLAREIQRLVKVLLLRRPLGNGCPSNILDIRVMLLKNIHSLVRFAPDLINGMKVRDPGLVRPLRIREKDVLLRVCEKRRIQNFHKHIVLSLETLGLSHQNATKDGFLIH